MRPGALLSVLAAALGLASSSLAKPLTVTQGVETFPPDELVSGTTSTPEQCARVPFAVWVTVDGKGDCIRYYAANLRTGASREALLYMSGDRLAGRTVLGGYAKDSPASLQREVDRWSREAGNRPYIFLARPGMYGSSGEHAERRRPREGKLVSAAYGAIASKYGLQTFHIAGQSGGGGLVATMLNMRRDVGCAVSASGAVAVFMRARLHNLSKDTTGFSDSYDPIDHVREIVRRPDMRIFVLGDRHDQNVPFATQERYVGELRKAGLSPVLVALSGTGSQNHGLEGPARQALALCAEGRADAEIVSKLTGAGAAR